MHNNCLGKQDSCKLVICLYLEQVKPKDKQRYDTEFISKEIRIPVNTIVRNLT